MKDKKWEEAALRCNELEIEIPSGTTLQELLMLIAEAETMDAVNGGGDKNPAQHSNDDD